MTTPRLRRAAFAIGICTVMSLLTIASVATAIVRPVATARTSSLHQESRPSSIVLGMKFAGYASGFGTVEPRTIQYGIDGYSSVSHIHWSASTWGTAYADGVGTAWYVPANGARDKGSNQRAVVVAFGLGGCRSPRAYTQFTLYFPSEHETFSRRYYLDACTGQWSIPYQYQVGVSTAPCSAAALASAARANVPQAGVAGQILSYACVGNVAGAIVGVNQGGGYGAAMSFRAVGAYWKVVAGGNILPAAGLSPPIFRQLNALLSTVPQNTSDPTPY